MPDVSENQTVRGSIDWLRYSVPADVGPRAALPAHSLFEPSDRELTPLRFYDRCVALVAGRCDWHSQYPERRLLVTLSGSQCALCVAEGLDMAEVLQHALVRVTGRVTRLDFALDVFTEADPMDVKRAWDAGRVRCAAFTCGDVGMTGPGGVDLGRTVYLGSRSSERILRVYDKARCEGLPSPWVRIELECKGRYAHVLARTMLASGIIPAGKAALRVFVAADVDWFTAALHSVENVPMTPLDEKETDRRRWYREQILPAMERDLARGPERRWLRFQLQRLLDESEQDAQHGPVVPPVPVPIKVARGIRTLVEHEGFDRASLLRAHEAGSDLVLRLLLRLGYHWDVERREWGRDQDAQ